MTKNELWVCPTCERKFIRKNQFHSCKRYPIEKHFEGKAEGKRIYEALVGKLSKAIGAFTVQSLPCCIHFDNVSTFAAAKIGRHGLQLEFSLGHVLNSNRISKVVQVSSNKFLHFVPISSVKEVNNTLINWVSEAYADKASVRNALK